MRLRLWRRGDGPAKLRGEEHQPDVVILISVVALAAIGILTLVVLLSISLYLLVGTR